MGSYSVRIWKNRSLLLLINLVHRFNNEEPIGSSSVLSPLQHLANLSMLSTRPIPSDTKKVPTANLVTWPVLTQQLGTMRRGEQATTARYGLKRSSWIKAFGSP
jgi:hypothetical protein